MKKLSLRWKITLLVGLITAAACLGITLNGVFSAPAYYSALLDSGLAEVDVVSGAAESGSQETPLKEPQPGAPSYEYYATTRLFSIQSLLVMAVIIAAALGLTYLVTGRILRPLNALNDSVKEIGGESLNHRVPLPKDEDEVRELTVSFNAMLGRLEEAFQIQKNFAANAAHELKTPLAVMKTSLQVLELDEEPAAEDYREFAGDVRISLERLSGTVENLLALANDSAEEQQEVSLKALLKQAAEALRAKADEKGVTVTVTGESEPVLGNRVLLYRVFFNLMENAVKYNRKQGRVDVALGMERGRPCVTVRDTGLGIPEESLRHIWEPFYRADESRSQRIPGSGLGLSIVKLVLDRCGGTAEVDSEMGKGTTVRIML